MSIVKSQFAEHFCCHLRSRNLNPLLLHGDAYAVLMQLPSDSVDCCMTSPPYWGKRHYTDGGLGLEGEYQEFVAILLSIFGELKRIVLVLQDALLGYMRNEFQFSHLNTARIGDPMHIHAYGIHSATDRSFRIQLGERLSTDANGVARCLGLQAETDIELQEIIRLLESKLSDNTLLAL